MALWALYVTGDHHACRRPPPDRFAAVLNHTSGTRGGIAGVYQRHDWAGEKRAAVDAWAAHVLAVAERRFPAANVIALSRSG
jgi:hypothetical protein